MLHRQTVCFKKWNILFVQRAAQAKGRFVPIEIMMKNSLD